MEILGTNAALFATRHIGVSKTNRATLLSVLAQAAAIMILHKLPQLYGKRKETHATSLWTLSPSRGREGLKTRFKIFSLQKYISIPSQVSNTYV